MTLTITLINLSSQQIRQTIIEALHNYLETMQKMSVTIIIPSIQPEEKTHTKPESPLKKTGLNRWTKIGTISTIVAILDKNRKPYPLPKTLEYCQSAIAEQRKCQKREIKEKDEYVQCHDEPYGQI